MSTRADSEIAPFPDPPIFVVCGGRKGQGKSELAFVLWDSWEGDRVCIDFTTSVGKLHPDPETLDLVSGESSTKYPFTRTSGGPLPDSFPNWYRTDDQRLSLRYVPDHKDPDMVADIDRVIGLWLEQGDILIWLEEAGYYGQANRVPPNYRAVNQMGRHKNVSKIETMPRLMDVDPLIPAQADLIFAFDMPNPDDRKRFAEVAGFNKRDIDEAMNGLEDHGYVRYHANAHELAIFPPLPLETFQPKRRRHIERHLDEDPPA